MGTLADLVIVNGIFGERVSGEWGSFGKESLIKRVLHVCFQMFRTVGGELVYSRTKFFV